MASHFLTCLGAGGRAPVVALGSANTQENKKLTKDSNITLRDMPKHNFSPSIGTIPYNPLCFGDQSC